MDLFVGFDPGGQNYCFGVCLLNAKGELRHQAVRSVKEAVSCIDAEPTAIGVDAPLWWSIGAGGGRKADNWIRTRYSIQSGTVQSVNSLRGAAVAQGFLIVDRVRATFPNVMVTEAHPKALLISLYGSQDAPDIWERFSSDFGLVGSPSNEHERDAAVAAVCAREGHYGRWKLDLSCDRFPEEQDPERHWIGPVRYFWPNA